MDTYAGRTFSATTAIETLERLRFVSGVSETEWLDALHMNRKDYALVRSGLRDLKESSVLHLSSHLKLEPEAILLGELDFHEIEKVADQRHWHMPEEYSKATFGRRRTTITSFEYLEKKFGWRLRYDILRHLKMSELMLENEFAPVSMQFITDVCSYLSKRRFQRDDFFAMGAYSYEGNHGTILSRRLAEFSSVKDVLQHMWGDLLPLLEQNCIYKFLKLTDSEAHLQVTSDPHVAAEMGKRHLGNEHICALKAGMMASAPAYIGEPLAHVREKTCVHRGDDACLFVIRYPKCH